MLRVLLTATVLLNCVSVAYCVLCLFAALRYLRDRKRSLSFLTPLPPISLLKPLKGTDPEMFENLRSHCAQNYPIFEILFGVGDPDDPAAQIVKRLQQEFPNCSMRLVHCTKNLGANGKVSTLAQLVPFAKYDILLVNDSDIRVEAKYLSVIAAELQKPGVGLVTCLYRGIPARTLYSNLESLGISADFVPGVLVASLIEGGIRFGLGSTLAFRKKDLEAIGGFESLANYLADDYHLGRRVAERGLKVDLSSTVVETHLPAYTLSAFIKHQLRWMRTIRASRPAGYCGLPLTFTLAWAFAALLLSRGAPWGWAMLAIAAFVRLATAIITGNFLLRDLCLPRLLWLLPVRDLIAPFIWAAGLVGRTIVWRDMKFKLKNGKLIISGQENSS